MPLAPNQPLRLRSEDGAPGGKLAPFLSRYAGLSSSQAKRWTWPLLSPATIRSSALAQGCTPASQVNTAIHLPDSRFQTRAVLSYDPKMASLPLPDSHPRAAQLNPQRNT
jgi:hypothetical protein